MGLWAGIGLCLDRNVVLELTKYVDPETRLTWQYHSDQGSILNPIEPFFPKSAWLKFQVTCFFH